MKLKGKLHKNLDFDGKLLLLADKIIDGYFKILESNNKLDTADTKLVLELIKERNVIDDEGITNDVNTLLTEDEMSKALHDTYEENVLDTL